MLAGRASSGIYDVEIRRIICSTRAIELLNVPYRRAVARGHFPTEQAALKCLYLVARSLDLTGRGRARWVTRWKSAPNAFAITFAGRTSLYPPFPAWHLDAKNWTISSILALGRHASKRPAPGGGDPHVCERDVHRHRVKAGYCIDLVSARAQARLGRKTDRN